MPDLQIAGGEGGIRTPDTRQGMAAFEAARFNHSRTSPHQRQPNCRPAASVFDGRQDPSSPFSLAKCAIFWDVVPRLVPQVSRKEG